MAILLLRNRLEKEEIDELHSEFPQLSLHLEWEQGTPEWEQVEILYGDQLTPAEFAQTSLLQWIHLSQPSPNGLCLKEIEAGGTLLITNTKDEDIHQISEFALAAILTFSKKLFDWKEEDPLSLWESSLRREITTLFGATLLQIGLGAVGSRIAHLCRELGMRTWGVGETATFHPDCVKTFKAKDLHSLLPHADVVSLATPRGEKPLVILEQEQLSLIKQDATLLILGLGGAVDEEAVADLARSGRFRGVVIDAFAESPLPENSKLWGIPNLLITPEVASYPKSKTDYAYQTFRYNLRRFIHEDFDGMKNLVHGILH